MEETCSGCFECIESSFHVKLLVCWYSVCHVQSEGAVLGLGVTKIYMLMGLIGQLST